MKKSFAGYPLAPTGHWWQPKHILCSSAPRPSHLCKVQENRMPELPLLFKTLIVTSKYNRRCWKQEVKGTAQHVCAVALSIGSRVKLVAPRSKKVCSRQHSFKTLRTAAISKAPKTQFLVRAHMTQKATPDSTAKRLRSITRNVYTRSKSIGYDNVSLLSIPSSFSRCLAATVCATSSTAPGPAD